MSREHPFWTWFAAHEARIKTGMTADARTMADEVGDVFRASYPSLCWQIGPNGDRPWEFCVSADGIRDRFPLVRRAVAAAPEIPGWFVTAFRQRGGVDCAINMGGQRLTADDIWCEIAPAAGGVRLKLLIRGLTRATDDLLSRAAVILLDNALGEYDAVMRVDSLTHGPLPDEPEGVPGLVSFRRLPAVLDLLTGGHSPADE